MRDPQELFNELQEIKDTQKSIRREYRDMLAQDGAYQTTKEEYDLARQKKKEAELSVQSQMGESFNRLEELNQERVAIEEMLTDIAVTAMSKGEVVTITDADHNEYAPNYKVSFKKID